MERESLDEVIDEWDETWLSWTVKRTGEGVPRDPSWRTSIERFMQSGLPIEELRRLVRVAMESTASPDQTWKFFCGCCWRAISDLQETARQLIEDGVV